MRKELGILAVALIAVASQAHADGLYLSAGAGASFLTKADNTNGSPKVDVESSYDGGLAVSGAVGYAFPFGLRLEGEMAYRRLKLDKLRIKDDGGLGAVLGLPSLNGITTPAQGTETALSWMINAWYDLKTGTPFTPYAGGGIGLARIKLDSLKVGGIKIADDHDHVLAYQLGAGVAYALTPNVSVTLDYRYFETQDARLKDISGNFDSEFRNHSIMGGIRVGF